MTPDSGETDKLLQAASTGDREVFAQIFARHRESLCRMIEFRLDPQLAARFDASDVVQETEMEALRRLPDYLDRRPMPFRLWLRKMAIERLLNLRRHHFESARRSVTREVRLPERSSCELAQQLAASSISPSGTVDRRERGRRIQQALAQLPSDDREVLLMRFVEGYSNQEVAYLLEIEPDAASKRHGRALLRLQEMLVRIS